MRGSALGFSCPELFSSPGLLTLFLSRKPTLAENRMSEHTSLIQGWCDLKYFRIPSALDKWIRKS